MDRRLAGRLPVAAEPITTPDLTEKIMVPFTQLYEQNHDIAELTKVLSLIIDDRESCDTAIANDLFQRFSTQVDAHMATVDQNLYARLLSDPDSRINAIANRFIEGGKEINRIYHQYTRRWFRKGLHIDDHRSFVRETKEIFQLLDERIQAEIEQLYPLVRQMGQNYEKRSA